MKTYVAIIHIVLLALMIAPNCMYYASANILSDELKASFGSQTAQLAYTLISVPSIFSVVTLSMLIDAFGTVILFPVLQAVCCIGTVLSVISAPLKSKACYLIGRFCYGVAGEATLTGQSRIIANLLPQRFQPAAYSVAFCGYMLGEALAGWLLPVGNGLRDSMLLVLGLQVFGLLMTVAYSVVLRAPKSDAAPSEPPRVSVVVGVQASSEVEGGVAETVETTETVIRKEGPLSRLLQNLRELRGSYFLLLAARILFQSAKSTFNSRSVQGYQAQLSVSQDTAKTLAVTESITSAAAFLAFSALSATAVKKIQYLVLFGAVLITVFFGVFAASKEMQPGVGYAIAVGIGISFGAFASNASALLVKLAGKQLGASALGIVFSLQYLIMSGMIPLAEHIANHTGEWLNGTIFCCFAAITVVLFTVVVHKWIKW